MNSKNYIFDDIPEEIDSNHIDPLIGQKTPVIKPKLDDTIPSILNLSSEASFQKRNKNSSFHIDNSKVNKNYVKYNSIIPIMHNNSNFNKIHCKALSNEVFTNPKVFNFLGSTQETEKSHKDEDDDNSSYYEGMNFDGIINFWNDNIHEENEENNKKVIIDDENGNIHENEIEEDINEGFNILNMLQKGKNKNKI